MSLRSLLVVAGLLVASPNMALAEPVFLASESVVPATPAASTAASRPTAPVVKDSILLLRADFARGSAGFYTVGVIAPEIEVWVFGIRADHVPTDVEVGRLWLLWKGKHATLLGGAYLAGWPDAGQAFVIPWLSASAQYGKFGITADLAGYIPLNGGPWVFFSDEVFAGYAVAKTFKLGVATAFWEQDAFDVRPRVGPAVKWQVDATRAVQLRYLFGENGSNVLRLQYKQKF